MRSVTKTERTKDAASKSKFVSNKDLCATKQRFDDSKSAEDSYVESSSSSDENQEERDEDTSSLISDNELQNSQNFKSNNKSKMKDSKYIKEQIKINNITHSGSAKSIMTRKSRRSLKSVAAKPKIVIEGIEMSNSRYPNAMSPIRKSSKEGEYIEADSLIKIFSLNVNNQVDDEEEKISDLEMFVKNMGEEELQAEVPRQIFNASRVVAHRISNLDKNEYGDYIYKENDFEDNASQRLKKAGDVLKFWIERLKSISKLKNLMRHTTNDSQKETCDRSIQVEFESENEARDFFPNKIKGNKKKDSNLGAPQMLKPTSGLKRMNSRGSVMITK